MIRVQNWNNPPKKLKRKRSVQAKKFFLSLENTFQLKLQGKNKMFFGLISERLKKEIKAEMSISSRVLVMRLVRTRRRNGQQQEVRVAQRCP